MVKKEGRFAFGALPCRLTAIPQVNQARSKLDYVVSLGPAVCACIGNGRNDSLMVKEAALGIGVLQAEGAAVELLMAADIVCLSVVDALSLFKEPKRLIATLRN